MPDTKVSALPAASVALGTDELPINEAGVSKKLTVAQIQTLILASAQPLDPDLTAIAALSTTAYGRAFLALVAQANLTALLNGAALLPVSVLATGALTSGNGTTIANLIANGAAGTARGLSYQSAGLNRWAIRAIAAAESGANAGSDLAIYSYDDAGANIGNPLLVTRSTGLVTLANGLTVGGIRTATPCATQVLAAATTILANAETVAISCTGAVVSTAAPTIANGADGQVVTLINVGAGTYTIKDQGTLASSNLRLTATSVALAPRQSVRLMYSATVGDWVQVGALVAVI